MSSKDFQPTEIQEFRVAVTPASVDAGARLLLKAYVATSLPLDLTGQAVQILDSDDQQQTILVLEPKGGGVYESDELELDAPLTVGEHLWSARLDVTVNAGEQALRVSTPVSFTVVEHRITVSVFNTPTAVTVGDVAVVTLGAKCICGCYLGGQAVSLQGDLGEEAVTVTLGSETWPGTEALYFAVANLPAGTTEGLSTWEARVEPEGLPAPHETGTADFTLRYVPAPEHVLRVEVFDRQEQTPIEGASVVVHPFRTATDREGVATIKVPKGKHRVFVSGYQYYPFREDVDIDGDISIKAELLWESEEEFYEKLY